jgi:hypothetical protein
MKQAYPLQWPDGWPRTPPARRTPGQFKVPLATARDELLDELRLLGAREVVISTMIPARNDGLPYARGRPVGGDPGVAVYFTLAGRPKTIACDAYASPEANLRAVGLSIAAMRALDRYGVSGLLDRVFTGLDALPPPDAIDWRRELGFRPDERPTEWDVTDAFRRRARDHHPDHGGSDAAMARLVRARELALRELGPASK